MVFFVVGVFDGFVGVDGVLMLLCGLFNFGWVVFILYDGLIWMEFGWEGIVI